ncbi:hypothetical protein ACJEBK_18200 [Peribacillus frigoritolerans]|uniref:hypothetical protein n=1 Tax=Peribacillus frigoritolerans TaxID=450367 RepID=UPI003871C762
MKWSVKESEYLKNINEAGVNDEDRGGNAVQNKVTAKAAHLASCLHKGGCDSFQNCLIESGIY